MYASTWTHASAPSSNRTGFKGLRTHLGNATSDPTALSSATPTLAFGGVQSSHKGSTTLMFIMIILLWWQDTEARRVDGESERSCAE